MIGTWRWILALLVVVGHLYTPWWPASYAVFSFYIISGFLMTLITNEHYGFSLNGLKAFWANRFLRLYPAYYVACLMSLLILISIPNSFVHNINGALIFPETTHDIITNITMLGLAQVPDHSRLVPPAWALSIEIIYYFVISSWAGRSQKNAFFFLCFSILYLVAVYILADFSFQYRYFHVGAGALPFAVGTNIYFHRIRIQKLISSIPWSYAFIASLGIYVLVFAGGNLFGHGHIGTWFFYLNILSSALLLSVLWLSPVKAFKKYDAFLGDLSYPTYLFHWQVGIVVPYITGLPFKDWKVFLLATIIVTVLSIIEIKILSRPIEQYRKRIKSSL